MSRIARHANNMEVDFEQPLSPAFERAVEALDRIHLDSLSSEDIQIISEAAKNMANAKAYRLVHPGTPAVDYQNFFRRPEVKAAIQQLKKHHLIYTEIDYKQKMSMLWDIATFCTGTMFDAEGNEIMKNPGAAKAAIAEMNKMAGDIAPEKKEIVIKQAELTEEELLEKIQSLTNVLDLTPDIENAVLIEAENEELEKKIKLLEGPTDAKTKS